MPTRIPAQPQDVPGHLKETGKRVQGLYNLVAYVYGPQEDVPAGRTTLSELRALHGGGTQQSLVVPFTGDIKFTFGPDLLRLNGDRVIVQIEFAYKPQAAVTP